MSKYPKLRRFGFYLCHDDWLTKWTQFELAFFDTWKAPVMSIYFKKLVCFQNSTRHGKKNYGVPNQSVTKEKVWTFFMRVEYNSTFLHFLLFQPFLLKWVLLSKRTGRRWASFHPRKRPTWSTSMRMQHSQSACSTTSRKGWQGKQH